MRFPRKVAYVCFIAVLAVLVYFLLSPLIVRVETREVELSKLPELFCKAVFMLNSSKSYLEQSAVKKIVFEEVSSLAREAEDTYIKLSKAHEVLVESESSLGEKLRESSKSYMLLAKASVPILNASHKISSVRKDLEKALSSMLDCKVDNALYYWSKCEENLLKARKELKDALLTLLEVNSSNLLSTKHRRVYNSTVDEVLSTIKTIDELVKLFNIVKENRELIKMICNGTQLCKCDSEKLSNDFSSVCPCKVKWFSYEVSLIKRKFVLETRPKGSKGPGAGYESPSSDD